MSPASLRTQTMPNAMDTEKQDDPVIVAINGLYPA